MIVHGNITKFNSILFQSNQLNYNTSFLNKRIFQTKFELMLSDA